LDDNRLGRTLRFKRRRRRRGNKRRRRNRKRGRDYGGRSVKTTSTLITKIGRAREREGARGTKNRGRGRRRRERRRTGSTAERADQQLRGTVITVHFTDALSDVWRTRRWRLRLCLL